MATCAATGLLGCTSSSDCAALVCGGSVAVDKASCKDSCCTCEDRAWFFFAFGAYMTLLLGVAVTARATAPARSADDANGKPALREHFMATGHFGTVVLTLTLFSTAFSGYTVVGVPQEASEVGWVALRWAAIGVPINLAVLLFYPRLRRIGVVRKYNSPTDIISDRFHARSLRFVSALTMLTTLFIFTTGQVKAIISIMDALSLGRMDTTGTAIMIMSVVVVCEWIGGQRSVAISDAMQASIMLCSFVVMPFVVMNLYGSLSAIADEHCQEAPHCVGANVPWIVRSPTTTGSCPRDAYCTVDSLAGNTSSVSFPLPEAFRNQNCWASTLAHNHNGTAYASSVTPEQKQTAVFVDHGNSTAFDSTALTMFSFMFNMIPFPLNTHIVQKIYVAKTDEILKRSCMLMIYASLVCNLPSIYYGMVSPFVALSCARPCG